MATTVSQANPDVQDITVFLPLAFLTIIIRGKEKMIFGFLGEIWQQREIMQAEALDFHCSGSIKMLEDVCIWECWVSSAGPSSHIHGSLELGVCMHEALVAHVLPVCQPLIASQAGQDPSQPLHCKQNGSGGTQKLHCASQVWNLPSQSELPHKENLEILLTSSGFTLREDFPQGPFDFNPKSSGLLKLYRLSKF